MVAWHPGGELLASASYDDTIKLWADQGDEWECVQTLSGAPALATLPHPLVSSVLLEWACARAQIAPVPAPTQPSPG